MISIIIPTYNAGSYLEKLLPQIKTQNLKNYELIIIDSSSNDDTVEIAKLYADIVKVIPQSEFDHGGTRDLAANLAQGDILIFLTQDALPANKQTLLNITKAFEEPTVAAAYGRQLSYPDTNLFGKHLREFNYPDCSESRSLKDVPRLGIKVAQLSNSFSAYRKSIFDKLGGFPRNLILGEDVYLGGKMINEGYTLSYVADAEVYHSHSYTVVEEFKRYFDIGAFHCNDKWLIKDFGKATGEGKKYVLSELKYLISKKAVHLIPSFCIRNAAKLLGYKMGFNYAKLPNWLVKKSSMHWRWWDKQ